jgi:hypothetical protein
MTSAPLQDSGELECWKLLFIGPTSVTHACDQLCCVDCSVLCCVAWHGEAWCAAAWCAAGLVDAVCCSSQCR